MSRTTKRKHVMKEILDDDYDPPKSNQQIVRIVGTRGNNLHEIETADDVPVTYLVSMPTKFRKNVWIKRGDYVIIEPIDEGDKVKGEIVRILTAEHKKIFTKDGIWPKKFTNKRELDEDPMSSDDEAENGDGKEFSVRNSNRKHFANTEENESSDSDSD